MTKSRVAIIVVMVVEKAAVVVVIPVVLVHAMKTVLMYVHMVVLAHVLGLRLMPHGVDNQLMEAILSNEIQYSLIMNFAI